MQGRHTVFCTEGVLGRDPKNSDIELAKERDGSLALVTECQRLVCQTS